MGKKKDLLGYMEMPVKTYNRTKDGKQQNVKSYPRSSRPDQKEKPSQEKNKNKDKKKENGDNGNSDQTEPDSLIEKMLEDYYAFMEENEVPQEFRDQIEAVVELYEQISEVMFYVAESFDSIEEARGDSLYQTYMDKQARLLNNIYEKTNKEALYDQFKRSDGESNPNQ